MVAAYHIGRYAHKWRSKLAGTGAGGQMVGGHAGQALRRLRADVGAAFPEGNGQTSQSLAG